MAEITIDKVRHEIAREANHEAAAILVLLKDRFKCLDQSEDTRLLIRGLVLRLDVLNDIIFEAAINDREIEDEELMRQLGSGV